MLAATKEYDLAKSNYDEADKESKLIERNLGSTEKEISTIQEKISETHEKSEKIELEYKELEEHHSELVDEMKEEYERARRQRNTFIIISNKTLQNLTSEVDNAKRKMEDRQRDYNLLSEIEASNYGVEFIPFYRDRYRDVANVKIDEAKTRLKSSQKNSVMFSYMILLQNLMKK